MSLGHREGRSPEATLSEIERSLNDLPMLHSVVAKLLALDRESDTFFDDVVELSEEDPPFAIRIIRLANSAAYAPAQPISVIRDAVARLGAQQIVGVSTAMAVARVFVPTTASDRFLWTHALEVACWARHIARLLGESGPDAELAYVCGLLHDIGRFIMLEKAPKSIQAVDETEWASPEGLIEAEMQRCGFDHAQLGWRACGIWELPDEIAEVVLHHHDAGGSLAPLVLAVQLADRISIQNLRTPEFWRGDPGEVECRFQDLVDSVHGAPTVSARRLADDSESVFAESARLLGGLALAAAP